MRMWFMHLWDRALDPRDIIKSAHGLLTLDLYYFSLTKDFSFLYVLEFGNEKGTYYIQS